MDRKTFIRITLFIIYFWFGALKVVDTSPASPLVLALLKKTMPFVEPHTFLVLFGLFEMLIGIMFLVPRWQKVIKAVFAFHMVTTMMPLVLLPHYVWTGFLIPTLEGQYIIKNIALIALVLNL